MIKSWVKGLLLLFVFFSSYSHNILPSSISLFGRLTYADIFGILALLLSPIYLRKLKIPKIFISYFLLLITFGVGLFISQNKASTLVEWSILLFLGLLFLIYSNTNDSEADLKAVILAFTWSSLFSCLIGLWDLSTISTGLPQIIDKGYKLRLPSGTFRNGGQAGAYMLLSVTILFPVVTSGVKRIFNTRQLLLMRVTFLMSVIYMIANAKFAAMIGASFGMVFYLILKRKFSTLIPIGIIGSIVIYLFTFLGNQESKITNRLLYKYNTRIIANIDPNVESAGSEWMEGNYGAAIQVFLDYPLTGSGIGGFHGVFHTNEVHSTPLKLLGETGILGTIGYFVFTISIFWIFLTKPKDRSNIYSDYLSHMLPFLLGCYISWIYTYHLRKREFWVLIFVIYMVTHLMNQYEHQKKINA